MDSKRSDAFYKLLHEVEWEIGNKTYNGFIQNWGPHGIHEGEGREFRYPVTYISSEGEKSKYAWKYPMKVLQGKELASAHYAFGANKLFVFGGITEALKMLEKRFNINFDRLLEDEKSEKVERC